jgi:hypothetical protein
MHLPLITVLLQWRIILIPLLYLGDLDVRNNKLSYAG